jgi:transformation/transcription domain-associated protein
VAWEKQRQSEIKVTMDTSTLGQICDAFTSGSVVGDLKRPPDSSTFPDDINRRVKTEPGLQSLSVMSPARPSIPNIGTPISTGQADEEYKPNAAMEEMIINFLIRVSLVIEPKDKEASSMYKQALDLLSQALEVWPNANVKFNYLEKLPSNIQPSQSKEPATALAQGLDVMNKVLEKQPHLFIRNNINHISQILEPCFSSKLLDAGKSLCSLLKMTFTALQLEATSTPQDVKGLYQRVEDLIQKHLTAVTTPQISLEVSAANSMISFAIFIIKSLAVVQQNYINLFIIPLVRVLQRLVKDLGSSASSHAKQIQIGFPF